MAAGLAAAAWGVLVREGEVGPGPGGGMRREWGELWEGEADLHSQQLCVPLRTLRFLTPASGDLAPRDCMAGFGVKVCSL